LQDKLRPRPSSNSRISLGKTLKTQISYRPNSSLLLLYNPLNHFWKYPKETSCSLRNLRRYWLLTLQLTDKAMLQAILLSSKFKWLTRRQAKWWTRVRLSWVWLSLMSQCFQTSSKRICHLLSLLWSFWRMKFRKTMMCSSTPTSMSTTSILSRLSTRVTKICTFSYLSRTGGPAFSSSIIFKVCSKDLE